MAKALLDLSASKGLGDKFFGDSDQVTPSPNRRYQIEDGEMAAGTFNPFMRDGYLSPAVNVFQSVTTDQALAAVIGSTIYDPYNDDYYLGERGNQIFQGDGLGDLATARVKNLSNSTLHDLEIYQLNGVRKLFYVYSRSTSVPFTLGGTLSSSVARNFQYTQFPAASGSTPPVVVATSRTTSASGSSLTGSFTTVSASNSYLYVAVMSYTANPPTGVTFNGSAMTLVNNNISGATSATSTWYLANPTVTTANIVATWAGSNNNLAFHAYQLSGAAAPTGLGGGTGTSSDFTVSSTNTTGNLLIMDVVAATATATVVNGTQVFNTTNTSGIDVGLYTAITGGAFRVGVADLPFANSDDAWLTTTATGAFANSTLSTYDFMRTADNGFAYFGQDNAFHKLDGTSTGGTNGTVTPNVLLFPASFRLTDAVDYRGNMFIVIHQSPVDTTSNTQTNYTLDCGVYIWDRDTTQIRMSDYVPVPGVRQIKKIFVAPNNSLRLITISSDGITQVRQFDGSNFIVIKELGIGAAPQFVDSLTIAGTKTMWLAPDGSLYCMGSSRPGGKELLARIAQIRAPQAETTDGYASNITAGALLYGSNSDTGTAGYRNDRQGVLLSYSDGTPIIKKTYPFDKSPVNSTNQTAHIGDIYSSIMALPFLATLQTITIHMAKGTATGATTQASVKIYFNGSSTAWATKTVTRDDIAKGYFNIKVGLPWVNKVQLEIEYATGITLSDTYDFHPYYAEVEYTATGAQAKA